MSKTLPRLEQLVSVRGIAAWIVVFYHSMALLRVAVPGLPSWMFTTIENGYLAVDFFFVLSGFIIFINYHDKFLSAFWRNSLVFYWNRLSRIYPLHLLMLLAYLTLALSFFYLSSSKSLPKSFTPVTFFENIFLIQAWAGTSTNWNVPSWSISAEWFVYLLFPTFTLMLRKYIGGLAAHFLLIAFVLAIVFSLSLISLNAVSGERLTELPLVRSFNEFLLGTAVGSLYIHHHPSLRRLRLALLLLIVVTVLAFTYLHMPLDVTVPLLCVLAVCILSVDESPLTRMLSIRPLVYLGEISYSTYMVHYFVYDLYKAVWLQKMDKVDPLSLFTSFGIVLIVSMLMHSTVEIPAQQYLRSGRFKRLATTVRV